MKFIKTAELEGLKLGLSTSAVVELLNVSFSDIFPITRRRKGFEKGDLQLSFFNESLDIIAIEIRNDTVELPAQISNEVCKVGDREINEIKNLLDNEHIVFGIYGPETRQNVICLKVASGVLLYFDDMILSKMVVM